MNNNRNETKKQGRLSRGERAFILENAHIKTPINIADEMNRDPDAVYNFLEKNAPSWKYVNPQYSDHHIMSAEEVNKVVSQMSNMARLIRSTNATAADAKRAVSPKTNISYHDFSQIEKVYEVGKDLVGALDKILDSIDSNIIKYKEDALAQIQEEMYVERKMIELLKLESQKKICQKHNMPNPPAPEKTCSEISKDDDLEIPAVYFCWDGAEILYVGKANNLKARMYKHHKIKSKDLVSWIEFPKSKLHQYEAFYIFAYEPALNNEIIQDLKHIVEN